MALTRPFSLDVLLAVVGIAPRAQGDGGISFCDAIEETRYLELRDELKPAELIPILRERPELMSSWWNWSYDKRCNAGWYILHESRIVGYHPDGPKLQFNSLEEAVAEFIVRELDDSYGRLLEDKERQANKKQRKRKA